MFNFLKILFCVYATTISAQNLDSLIEHQSDSSHTLESSVGDSLSPAVVIQLGSKEWYDSLWARIAINDEDSLLQIISEIEEVGNDEFYDLLSALKMGVLYQSENQKTNAGLVIIGNEITNESGDAVVPLFEVFPEKKEILEDESQLYADPFELVEIESSREIRAKISPITTKIELFHKNEKIRRMASERIGDEDQSVLGILDSAIQSEKDQSIKNLLELSKAKILLFNGNSDDKLQAVQMMERLRNPLAIPILEKQLESSISTALKNEVKAALVALKNLASIMSMIQTLFIGISLSSVLILVALGLAVIYGLMGVINMAHGEFMMIGAYTTYVIQVLFYKSFGDGFFWISLPFAFVVAGLFGVLIESTIIRKLYNRPLESLLATWGVSMLLIQGARSIFGDLTSVKMPKMFSGAWEISPQVMLPHNRLFIIFLTIFCLTALYVLFNKTNFGLKIRAVVQNRNMAASVGVKVRHIDRMTFFLGTGIAGIAGWAMTLIGNVVPNMGQTYIVDSFLVVVTGGVGKLLGTVMAGLGIGVTTKILEPIFEAVYGKAIILGLIILFLQIRPTGIFPNKGRGEDS